METRGSEIRRELLRKRKPLGDLTNSISLPCASSSALNFKSLKPAALKKQKPSLPTPNRDEILPGCDNSSTGSSRPGNPSVSAVDPDADLACTTPGARVPVENSVDNVDAVRSEVHVTYCRQRAKRGKNTKKAMETGMQSSCPPLGRTINFGGKLKMGHEAIVQPQPRSVPLRKSRKKRCHQGTEPLPQDFIERQKAYFAEIDAFQLLEEEVSESELD